MTARRHRRSVAGAGLALLAVLVQAGPAAAHSGSHATVGVSSPGAGQQIGDADVTVRASVSAASGTAVERVSMTLSLTGRPAITATGVPSAGSVSFPVSLTYNGKYDVALTADWKYSGFAGLGSHEGTSTGSRSFLVAVPATSPANVKTAVDATSRAVTITWDKNPEPDLIRYEVKRAKGTSSDFTTVAEPKAGETTYTDASTSSSGGDYRYVVVAVRKGVPGDEEISSDPSAMTADAVAKVPDPPPPPTTAAPAGSAGAGGTGTGSSIPAGSPGAITTPGTVDLSGFNTVRSQTRSAAPRTVPLPDPGFQSTLPFAPVETIADEPFVNEDGDLGEVASDSQFRELGDEVSSNDKARTMAFFAAGLLATVLLMHVLWVKSEVRRVPLEALEPEDVVPADGWSGKSRRGRRQDGPGPTLADIGDADFAPVVVAPKLKGVRGPARSGPRQRVTTGV